MTRLIQSEVAPLRRLVLKHPRDAFVSQENIDGHWRELNYLGPPDLAAAVREYDAMVEMLSRLGVRIDFLPRDARVGLDSLYVRDAAVVCRDGVILGSMGKSQRQSEPAVLGDALAGLRMPVLGAIGGEGRLEGGDAVWIDDRFLAVGLGARTNSEGVRQLRALLEASTLREAAGHAAPPDCDVIEVPLPQVTVPGDVFHLMSVISPVAEDLALVYPPLLPAGFREALLTRGIRLVEVPDDEFDSLGCNVFAVAPRRVIAVDGNPRTRRRLEHHGVEVIPVQAREICHKGAGGPTCLTRPLVRGKHHAD